MATETGVSIPGVAMSIPVVDFEKVLSCSEGEGLASCDAVQELHSAFTTVGFVFIRNHGIDRRMVGGQEMLACSHQLEQHETTP